jgi:hypothetical protein
MLRYDNQSSASMRMRRFFECLFVFMFLCLPASGQISDACRADLQHLILPQSSQLQFLFSDHGADIYSWNPSDVDATWFQSNGIRVIVVYQDEQARQQAIHNLMQPDVLEGEVQLAGDAHHTTLDKLKYAMIRMGIGLSKDTSQEAYVRDHHVDRNSYFYALLTSSWEIREAQYFEPPSCEPPITTLCINSSGQYIPCAESGFDASGDGDPNWIAARNIQGRYAPYDDPQFVRIVEAMKEKVEELEEKYQPPPPPLETILGSSEAGPYEAAAAEIVDTYSPCTEATQPLEVPGGIHSALPGQTFSFMFSQDGIDAYAVRSGAPPKYEGVLLVFQDDKTRREYLRSFISTGAVFWPSVDGGNNYDWKSVVNVKYAVFKYEVLEYDVFTHNSHSIGKSLWLTAGTLYAPRECYSRRTSVGALTRDILGSFLVGPRPRLYPGNGVMYKAGMELQKLEAEAEKPNRKKPKDR